MKGDLSLQEGRGAATVFEAGITLAGAVGPGIRLIRDGCDESGVVETPDHETAD